VIVREAFAIIIVVSDGDIDTMFILTHSSRTRKNCLLTCCFVTFCVLAMVKVHDEHSKKTNRNHREKCLNHGKFMKR
jgi:hypothetical protein